MGSAISSSAKRNRSVISSRFPFPFALPLIPFVRDVVIILFRGLFAGWWQWLPHEKCCSCGGLCVSSGLYSHATRAACSFGDAWKAFRGSVDARATTGDRVHGELAAGHSLVRVDALLL